MKKKQFFSGNKQHLKTILCLQGLSSELFVWLRIKMTLPQLKTNFVAFTPKLCRTFIDERKMTIHFESIVNS